MPQLFSSLIVQEEAQSSGNAVGVDLSSGDPIDPMEEGIVDNYVVTRQLIHSCTAIAGQLLLVDEVLRAGMSSLKG